MARLIKRDVKEEIEEQEGHVEPILTITRNEDQKVVLRIPLVDCALLYKGQKYAYMSDQEFLDREDQYNFTFFLDEYDNWVNSTIIINDWKCIYQESELE